jgi:transketolase
MENNNDWHHNRITGTIYEECLKALGESTGSELETEGEFRG